MTNEELQRTMEFILGQQAQFASNIQKLQEERASDEGRVRRLEESFQLLVQLAQATDTRLDQSDSHVGDLQSNMAALAAAQTHADERLSALINIVLEDRNGKTN